MHAGVRAPSLSLSTTYFIRVQVNTRNRRGVEVLIQLSHFALSNVLVDARPSSVLGAQRGFKASGSL